MLRIYFSNGHFFKGEKNYTRNYLLGNVIPFSSQQEATTCFAVPSKDSLQMYRCFYFEES